MRTLLLCHEGAPMMHSVTVGPIRQRLLEWPADDVDLFSIWSVPGEDTMAPAFEMTERFAWQWALDLRWPFGVGTGAGMTQCMELLPVFVRVAARARLVAAWQRERARQDQSFIPAVLESAA